MISIRLNLTAENGCNMWIDLLKRIGFLMYLDVSNEYMYVNSCTTIHDSRVRRNFKGGEGCQGGLTCQKSCHPPTPQSVMYNLSRKGGWRVFKVNVLIHVFICTSNCMKKSKVKSKKIRLRSKFLPIFKIIEDNSYVWVTQFANSKQNLFITGSSKLKTRTQFKTFNC